MGAIYEAFDTILNTRVAIKENLCEEESLKAAFRREAQLLANLRHPSLPRCSDLLSIDAGQYLVMEYIEGDDLAMLMTKSKMPFPLDIVMQWAKDLLDILEYIHSQPTLHRDIKPDNIKVKNGRAYLLDFGLAYGYSGDMTTIVSSQFNWNCHSLRYSPPEQLRCERTTPASDLYSLAATLYSLLTAVPPESSDQRLQMILAGKGDPLKDLRFYRPSLDENVRRAIMQALALDMNERPQSAVEMRRLMFPEKVAKPKRALARKVVMTCILAGILALGIVSASAITLLNSSLCQSSSRSFFQRVLRCEAQPESPKNLPPSVSPKEQAARLTSEAEELLQSAKYEESIKKAKAALALDPNNPYTIFIYGDALWDTGGDTADSVEEMPEVQEQADIILKSVLSPHSAKEYVARAWANLARGKADIAIADATAALELNPASVAALMIRASAKAANAEVDNKKAIESFADYDEAIRLMPNYTQAYANRAATYAALGQLKLAVSDYTEAIRLLPRASFHLRLGYVHLNLQEFADARKNFQKALKLSPRYYQAYIGLGDAYFQEEDWSNAVKNYQSANQISQTQYALSRLGHAYIYLEEFEKAVKHYRKALDIDPGDYRSQNGLAYAYANLDEFKLAVDNYTRALELAPEDNREFLAFVYKYRAQAYRQSGRESLAEKDEKRARDLGL